MKLLDTNDFMQIVEHIRTACAERQIDGVLAIGRVHDPIAGNPGLWSPPIYWDLINRFDALDNASDGKKYNLLVIALAKVGYVLTHGAPSGTVEYEGEVGYRGGIFSEDRSYAYAFSGGTEDQDVEIAHIAEVFHKSLK